MLRYFIFVFFIPLVFFSCQEPDPVKTPLAPEQKPIPAGSRKINILVDNAYNLSNTKAYSLLDSIEMSGTDRGLYTPKSFESDIFFLDEISGEVLAVVYADTISSVIQVNASSVARSLFNLIPAYHSLSSILQRKFEVEASNIAAYRDFVGTVDRLLKNNLPIYSTEPTFISQIIQLNKYILTNYLGEPNLNGGRVKSDGDFTRWLTREAGATLDNQVHSYVYAEFVPPSGPNVSTILDPQPILVGLWSKKPLTAMGLEDDCYTVRLNQTHDSAKTKNILELASGLTGMFLNTIFGHMGNRTKNDCIGQIAGSIVKDLSTAVVKVVNLSLEDVLKETISTGYNAIRTAQGSHACLMYVVVNKRFLTKVLISKANVWLIAIDAGMTAYDMSALVPYLIAIVDPVALTGNLQLHDGNLKEACVTVAKDGTLKEGYGAGETIYPGVKLIPEKMYADWERSGFKVAWKLDAGNGSVNLSSSSTGTDGKATVGWSLPDNRSGAVSLIAEIKDREGDHLQGSPLEFKTNVLDECEAGIITAPIITDIQIVCNSSNRVVVLVSFTSNESGLLLSGSYYGTCEQSEMCYPVRVLFMWTDGTEFIVAANAYSANIITGNENAGVIEITFSSAWWDCISGKTARESMDYWYPGYHWKMELMNKCNQRSAQVSF